MIEKIDIGKILKNHIMTLRKVNSTKISFQDIMLFYALPILFSLLIIYYYNFTLTKNATNILITSMSIFIALLLNLLLLLFDIIRKNRLANDSTTNDPKYIIYYKLLYEIYINISYCICIALFSIILLLIFPILSRTNKLIIYIISFLIYFLTSNFLLTMFMILKRMFILISKEMDKK